MRSRKPVFGTLYGAWVKLVETCHTKDLTNWKPPNLDQLVDARLARNLDVKIDERATGQILSHLDGGQVTVGFYVPFFADRKAFS